MTNLEYAQALRDLAAFYETHPDMPQPYGPVCFFYDREKFLSAVKELSHGGIVRKKLSGADSDSEYVAERNFSGLSLRLKISRALVCRLVKPAVYDCPDSLLEEAAEYQKA